MDDDVQVDMASALASMDADFGGGGEDSGELPPSSGQEALATPSPSLEQQAPVQANPWDAPPKSWKQDLHPLWQKYDPQTRQYIHEREKQALEGIMQYKTKYDPYGKLEEQYKPWVEKYKMPLHEASNNLLSAHIALMEGPPEVKQQVLQSLFNYPGVRELLQTMLTPQQQGAAAEAAGFNPQQVQQIVQQAVQQQVAPVQSELQAWREAQQAAALEESQKVVDAFIADPQNKYAQEVMPDMVRLVKAGLAADLKSAYEQACRMNPTVFAKMIEEEVQKATRKPGPGPKQVRSGQTPPASTKLADADEDIEDTMRSTLRDINSR